MDAEMCNMFGSLSLKAWSPEGEKALSSQVSLRVQLY